MDDFIKTLISRKERKERKATEKYELGGLGDLGEKYRFISLYSNEDL